MSFKIETCGWYKRRDGKKVRVVCVDAPGAWPVVVVTEDGIDQVYTAKHDGHRFRGVDHGADLIAQWTDEPEIGSLEWVRTLPKETKVWCAGMSGPHSFMFARAIVPFDSYKPPFFIVGTAEWANALPEGTKVRYNKWPKHDH